MYFSWSKTLVLSTFLIIFFAPVVARAATLSISPASGTVEVGERVTVKVMVSSANPINAISGVVSFPTGLFTIESVSKSGSILNFWVSEPNFSQGAGTLQFEGVTLGGFKGGVATVVTATLKAVKVGSGSIAFRSGQVLANDGQGTDVTDGTSGATFSVVPATVTPKPEPTPEPETPVVQPKPSLESPEIVLTSRYGEQAISGTSIYPNAQVLLTFVSTGGVKVFITGTTDKNGEFILLVPKTLKHGLYKVNAVVILGDLSNSRTSNEIMVSVGSFISDLSFELRLFLLLLILILLYLIWRSYEYMKKNSKLKFFVRKEAQDAEKIVHKSFKLLREDVGNNKQMKKDLDEAEDLIEKEISNIAKT